MTHRLPAPKLRPSCGGAVFFIIALILSVSASAYSQVEYPYQKQIEKGDVAKAEKDLIKKMCKSPDDVTYLYAASRLYLAESNPSRDIERAYRYACEGSDKLAAADEKTKAKLAKKQFVPSLFQSAVRDCCRAARQLAREGDTTEGYLHFLRTYTRCDKDIETTVIAWRDNAAFRDASNENSIAAYETFIRHYPSAKQVSDAQLRIYKIAYESTISADNAAQYALYIKNYPQSPYLLDILNRRNPEPYKEDDITAGNWREYISAANANQPSFLNAYLTQRSLMRLAQKTQNKEIAKYGFLNFTKSIGDSCWLVLHRIYNQKL